MEPLSLLRSETLVLVKLKSLSSGPPMEKTGDVSLDLNDPRVRAKIIKQYESYGEEFTKKEYGVDRKRVGRWRTLKDTTGSLVPRFADRGNTSTLSSKDIKKLESELLKDPYATNEELSNKIKNKISAREVGNILARSPHRFTWKLEQVDVEETFSPKIVKEGKAFLKEIHNIPFKDRVYMDETWASAGIARRKGRFPKDKKPWSPRNKKYHRMVVANAVTIEGWVHKGKIWNKPSISDDDFDGYVSRILAPKLSPGKVVFWDQYGKFGRVKIPKARHFSPKARKSIEARGATLKILPRYGKLFDPIEMVFGDTKRIYQKKVGEKLRSMKPSELKFDIRARLWHEAEKGVGPKSFVRAFKERASGQEFLRVNKEKGLE